ncbi:hypothetical protein D3C71_1861460 [compost metagenome]
MFRRYERDSRLYDLIQYRCIVFSRFMDRIPYRTTFQFTSTLSYQGQVAVVDFQHTEIMRPYDAYPHGCLFDQ